MCSGSREEFYLLTDGGSGSPLGREEGTEMVVDRIQVTAGLKSFTKEFDKEGPLGEGVHVHSLASVFRMTL